MSAGVKGSMDIYMLYQSSAGTLTAITISLRMVRVFSTSYYSERRIVYATETNFINPKLFGNYFFCEDEQDVHASLLYKSEIENAMRESGKVHAPTHLTFHKDYLANLSHFCLI